MNLETLLRRFRTATADKVREVCGSTDDLLWSDEEVADELNDAQDEAAIRARLLREDALPAMCRIALTPGTQTYKLHPKLYEIINLRLIPASGEPRTLHLQSREWLDNEVRGWRDRADPARYAIQDEKTLRVVGSFEAGDQLALECYRLPLKPMVSDFDSPEIHDAHHVHLIQWALYKLFSIPDADGFDPQRADRALKAFESYFGLHPGVDLRRSTRTDVVHHNQPIFLQ